MTCSFADLRVLVVDDIPMTRDLVSEILRHMGVSQVFKASGGHEALEVVSSSGGLINTILCDWNMPDMEGIDLLRVVRKENKDIPFLFLTGRDDVESVKMARDAGVDGYLLKPVCPNKLREKMERLLQKMPA
ncbi:MAG: hypothetical protein A2018_07305 [Alphaproteobacteria bacterium GWF2_58_20]|nr:MAG: hypothetical protein A2018_07305 [Alphaproteobacteria bacterium GWF2_58_20]